MSLTHLISGIADCFILFTPGQQIVIVLGVMPLIPTGNISLKLVKHVICCQTSHCLTLWQVSSPLCVLAQFKSPGLSRPTVSSSSRHQYASPVISSLTSQSPGSAFWILHIRWFAGCCCCWFWCARFNTKPPSHPHPHQFAFIPPKGRPHTSPLYVKMSHFPANASNSNHSVTFKMVSSSWTVIPDGNSLTLNTRDASRAK